MPSSPARLGNHLSTPAAFVAMAVALLIPSGCGENGDTPESKAPAGSASPLVDDGGGGAVIYPTGSVDIRPGATKVYGEPADVDFGVARPSSKLRTEIRLVNPTDSPVVIKAAVPTCQCTTVNVDGATIPPRGAVGIPMTLQVPSTTGEKKAAVNTVLVPGGIGPRLTLRAISAYAVQAIASSSAGGPGTLWIDALKPQGLTGEIRLTATDGRPFRVLSLNGGRPTYLRGTGEGSTSQSIGYDLQSMTQATMPKWMLIETDHPDAPMIEMRVRHMFSRLPHQFPEYEVKVQFDGYIANVGRIAPGETADFSLELKQFKNRTLSGLRSTNADFAVRLLQRKGGDGDRVRVTGSITPRPGVEGPFICPVQFITPEGAETMYVIGTVR